MLLIIKLLNMITQFEKLSKQEMKLIKAGSREMGLGCATTGQICPAPDAKYDGCCGTCDMTYNPSGKNYCS